MSNINITIKNTSLAAISEKNDDFQLFVKSDMATITVSGIGFQEQDSKIEFAENTSVNVKVVINEQTYNINEVFVSPQKSLFDNNISKARERHREIPDGTNLFELKNLPFDVTYVDEYDKVRCYNKGEDRVFPRSPGIIGRQVKYCHPPKSVYFVEKIVSAFKSGEKDGASFWINFQEKFVHIQYFAVRNDSGNL